MKKFLFICKKNHINYGVSSGLINSANFIVNYINSLSDQSEAAIAIAQDGNDIDRLVTMYNPTHVFIEAIWVTPDKFKELFSHKRHYRRDWYVRIHSKIPFIANEGIAFNWIKEYGKINGLHIAPNTQDFSTYLKDVLDLDRIVYLPNIYMPACEKPNTFKHCFDTTFNIGCFGAIRPLKNTLIQACAAIKFAESIDESLSFHVNGGRNEQGGDNVYKNIKSLFHNHPKHKLIEHSWMSHEDFIKLISHMDITMQVSYTESFNIVAADCVYAGVPLVVSSDIEWMPFYAKADPNSIDSIVNRLKLSYNFADYAPTINMWYLEKYNNKAKQTWNKKFNIWE